MERKLESCRSPSNKSGSTSYAGDWIFEDMVNANTVIRNQRKKMKVEVILRLKFTDSEGAFHYSVLRDWLPYCVAAVRDNPGQIEDILVNGRCIYRNGSFQEMTGHRRMETSRLNQLADVLDTLGISTPSVAQEFSAVHSFQKSQRNCEND